MRQVGKTGASLGGDRDRLIGFLVAGAVLVVGEEGGQRFGLLSGIAVSCVGRVGLAL